MIASCRLAAEGVTPTAIARLLTEEGVKPPTKRGSKWHHSTVLGVLTREAVA